MNKTVIDVKNISFTYPGQDKPAINDVSFSISENEYICIVGHNGSGKSTLSKLLSAILYPSTGTIHIKGQLLNKKNRAVVTKPIGIIFQNPDNQFIGSTVRDDIAFGLENHCVPQEEMEAIILRAAKLCNVSELLDSSPQSLSGGQKQRVAIAGIIALNADIIIFDEATSMLDPQGKMDIKQQMIDLKQKYGKTVISITHDMSQLLDADRVIALYESTKLMDGTVQEVIDQMDKLKVTKLDYPFAIKLSIELQKRGVEIPTLWKEEDLIQYLKYLKSRKIS